MNEWTPDDLADLTPEVRALLNDWDPIGIADLAPDEYDGLNGLILARLATGADDRASFCQFMATEAQLLSSTPESGDAFGALVYDWFAHKQPLVQRQEARPQLRKGRQHRRSHWNRPT